MVLAIERLQEYLKGYADAAYATYLNRPGLTPPRGERRPAFGTDRLARCANIPADQLNEHSRRVAAIPTTVISRLSSRYVLHRSVDQASRTYFDGLLAAGTSHQQIFASIYNTRKGA